LEGEPSGSPGIADSLKVKLKLDTPVLRAETELHPYASKFFIWVAARFIELNKPNKLGNYNIQQQKGQSPKTRRADMGVRPYILSLPPGNSKIFRLTKHYLLPIIS
jgi:hypothetical protein